jgi:hypothetical protein
MNGRHDVIFLYLSRLSKMNDNSRRSKLRRLFYWAPDFVCPDTTLNGRLPKSVTDSKWFELKEKRRP